MTETVACDVAVVGAGPAGLGAAVALRQRGVGRVIVLEREDEAGGVPRHCGHPPFGIREFGLPLTGPKYAQRLRELALRSGVEICTRHSVVAFETCGVLSVATPGGLLDVDAKRIVLATGARENPRAAQLVSGSRPLGVVNTGALQACLYLEHLQPNLRRPVIVGTDLVGLSAVWTCLSHGITPVAIIEPSERPVARWPLGLFPKLVGVPMFLRSHIAAIEGGNRVERVRVQPEQGPNVEIACDGVVFTGGFVPEAALASTAAIDIDRHSGGPAIDQFGRCSDPIVFAAGNLLRPVETAGWCFREGRRIGHAVADDLHGLLPPPASAVRVIAGDGVKYVVPQRIFPQGPSYALRNLQIRAMQPVRGVMTVEQNGNVAWRKRISTRPHRRILIPLAGIAQCAGPGDMRVEIEPGQPVGEH